MKKATILYCLMLAFLPLAGQDRVYELMNSRIDTAASEPLTSILIILDPGPQGQSIQLASGCLSPGGEAAAAGDQFRIASTGKSFVAAMILQLAAEGKIDLDHSYGSYMGSRAKLAFAEKFTIRQLLSHRSGLPDMYNDRWDSFLSIFLKDPQHQYSPLEIVDLYLDMGLQDSLLFEAGTDWHYSDMNYVLLGLLLERIEQDGLPQITRKRLLDPMDMTETYLEFYEDARGSGRLITQHIASMNMTLLNTSFDWAGGGWVSTNADLVKFWRGLFDGTLLSSESLEEMLEVIPSSDGRYAYGLGVFKSEFAPGTFYGHFGAYGSYAGYCPENDMALSYSISQGRPAFNPVAFINEILELILPRL